MDYTSKNYENRQKAPKHERLVPAAKPLAANYLRTTDASLGFMFNLVNDMLRTQPSPEQQPTAKAMAAQAIEQTPDTSAEVPASYPVTPMTELNVAAIREQVQGSYGDA